jgi:ferredoxin
MNYLWLYLAVMVVLWWLYLRRQRRIQRENAQQLQQSLEAGLAEPASLHPVIDTQRCIGSASCVKACPEDALGIVNGKAVLINGASCIGHGATWCSAPRSAASTSRRSARLSSPTCPVSSSPANWAAWG